MQIEFGVFDHLDRRDAPLTDFYEDRLRLIELYDRSGFRAFHMAEHHGSPLGMAPSPSLFLASAIQRTTRIRLGPLVYILPLYDPLRLIGEICMLDHLSNGRLDLGVGRGISAFELAYHNVNHLEAKRIYNEALEVILKGLTSDVLDHQGEYFRYFNVPQELRPLQQPHPPLWYGIGSPEGIDWAARNKVHAVSNAPAGAARGMAERYRKTWAEAHGGEPTTRMGIARHVYVADSAAEAERTAARAQQQWFASFAKVWRDFGANPMRYPQSFEEFRAMGLIVCGTPDMIVQALEKEISESTCNYCACRFAYGDLSYEESARSLELFTHDVMPRFQA